MIITMLIMGGASIGIGLTPNYSQIGILAPILLLCFRLSQGLAIGTVMAGVGAGLLVGTAVNELLVNLLNNSHLLSYG